MVRQLIFTLFSLLISLSAFADDTVDMLVRQSIYKFERLEAMNSENTRNGNSHLNNYVIELDPNWIEELPTKIILSSNFERLGTTLRNFNNSRKDALRFYVVVVNNYKARINEEANIPSRTVVNLSDYVSMPDKNSEYQRFLTEIRKIPASISDAMKAKQYSDRIVYFYGRIGLYKLDQQLKYYRTDFLSLEGDKLQPLDARLRPMAVSNVSSSDAPGSRIEKLVDNLVNGVQVLVDNNAPSASIECSRPLADIVNQTASLKAQQYASAISGMAGLLNAPETSQKIGGSRYLLAKIPSELPTDDFTAKSLPEKIRLLNENSTHKLYVVFYPIEFALPSSEWPAVANSVAQQSALAREANSVVIIIPYFKTICVGPGWLNSPASGGTAMLMPSVYTNDEALKNSMNTALALPGLTWETNFTHAYSKIPKTHYQFIYAISYQFYIVDKRTIVRHNATDNNNIYDLHILVDRRLPAHIELLQELKNENLAYGGPTSVQRVLDELASLQAQNPAFYQLDHGLKESSLQPTTVNGRTYSAIAEQFLLWFAKKKLSESQVWKENLFRFEGPEPNAPLLANFKNGYNPQTIEEQFELLDHAGLILAPFELDWITDGAGFLLACRYEDNDKKIIYGAATTAPIAAYFWRKGAKFFKRANGTFEAAEEIIDETLELWLRIKTRLKENLKWGDDVISDFEADFAKNLQMLRKFDNQPELVDSWKVLKDANVDDAIRKGASGELDFVRKYRDDFPERDVVREITDAGGYQKWIDNVAKGGAKTRILDKLVNLPDARAFVNSLDEIADAGLLNRIDNLPESRLTGLDKFYKNLKQNTPSGFGNNDYNFVAPKDIEFTGTKYVNGQATSISTTKNVSISYKNGFPEFHNTDYCPTINFSNGASGKYKYVDDNLSSSNYSDHFDWANEALASRLGKGTNSWPAKNVDGFHEVGNYRWDGKSPQFELKNANGVWEKYTWHHVEDGKTIIPVLSSVHSPAVGGFKHAGGNKILEFDFKGVFEFTGY